MTICAPAYAKLELVRLQGVPQCNLDADMSQTWLSVHCQLVSPEILCVLKHCIFHVAITPHALTTVPAACLRRLRQ